VTSDADAPGDWPSDHHRQEGDVEIRPVFTAEDFGADLAPEVRAQEDRIAAVAAGRHAATLA
jgi:hypothetical protein